MTFGESFGAFVGGFEHRQQGNIKWKRRTPRTKIRAAKKSASSVKNVRAALIEVGACGNQSRDGAHLRNQGFADEAVRRIRQSVHVEHAVVAVAVNDHAAGV